MSGDDPGDGSDNILDILFRHHGIEGKGDNPLVSREGLGKILRPITECLPIVRMEVKGNKVNAGADFLLVQKLDEAATVDAKGF